MNLDDEALSTTKTAAARLFRAYMRHVAEADEDALFNFLNALHSFGDKVSKLGRPNLNPSVNFVALRELRNLYHHEGELLHEVRMVHVPEITAISTDLQLLCLAPRSSAGRALARCRSDADRNALHSALRWYGHVINIEPAIFNVMVDVYELLRDKKIEMDDDSYLRFAASYDYETANGYPHHVNGRIQVHSGNVQTVLEALMQPISGAKPA